MTQITHLPAQTGPKILNATLKIKAAHRIVMTTRAIVRQSLRRQA